MSHMLCIGYGRCGLNKLYALNTQSSFTQTYILFFFFLSFRIPLSLLTTTQVSSTIPDRHVANNAVYDIWSNMLCPIFGTCDQSNTEFRLQSSTISRAGMYDDTGSLWQTNFAHRQAFMLIFRGLIIASYDVLFCARRPHQKFKAHH